MTAHSHVWQLTDSGEWECECGERYGTLAEVADAEEQEQENNQ